LLVGFDTAPCYAATAREEVSVGVRRGTHINVKQYQRAVRKGGQITS
jgi:hypothetical protein